MSGLRFCLLLRSAETSILDNKLKINDGKTEATLVGLRLGRMKAWQCWVHPDRYDQVLPSLCEELRLVKGPARQSWVLVCRSLPSSEAECYHAVIPDPFRSFGSLFTRHVHIRQEQLYTCPPPDHSECPPSKNNNFVCSQTCHHKIKQTACHHKLKQTACNTVY